MNSAMGAKKGSTERVFLGNGDNIHKAKSMRLWPLASHTTLGKLQNLSMAQFPYLWNEMISRTLSIAKIMWLSCHSSDRQTFFSIRLNLLFNEVFYRSPKCIRDENGVSLFEAVEGNLKSCFSYYQSKLLTIPKLLILIHSFKNPLFQ